MPIPYENATSGAKARDDIQRMLRRFGCTKLGFMDEFETASLLLAFEIHGRKIQLRASAKGWASMLLRERPWTTRMRRSKREYEQWALEQGRIAINSVLRDWVKGQVTAIETGVLQLEHVFLPYMIGEGGRTVAEIATERGLLAAPEKENQ